MPSPIGARPGPSQRASGSFRGPCGTGQLTAGVVGVFPASLALSVVLVCTAPLGIRLASPQWLLRVEGVAKCRQPVVLAGVRALIHIPVSDRKKDQGTEGYLLYRLKQNPGYKSTNHDLTILYTDCNFKKKTDPKKPGRSCCIVAPLFLCVCLGAVDSHAVGEGMILEIVCARQD